MNGEPIRLTRAQVREVDRLAVEEHFIPSIVLMENAARSVVDASIGMLDRHDEIAVLCGGGNNGGDGLAIARHLHIRGYKVSVALLTPPDKLRGDALTNWRISQTMDFECDHYDVERDLGIFPVRECQVVFDAMFGTGLTRAPGPAFAPYIDVCNEYSTRGLSVIAVDVPSGLDCDTGEPLGKSCIRATRTVTFVASKAGFNNPAAKQYLGEVTVGDIGCPREIIARVVAGHAAGG